MQIYGFSADSFLSILTYDLFALVYCPFGHMPRTRYFDINADTWHVRIVDCHSERMMPLQYFNVNLNK